MHQPTAEEADTETAINDYENGQFPQFKLKEFEDRRRKCVLQGKIHQERPQQQEE